MSSSGWFFLSPVSVVKTGLRWGGVKLHPYHSHRGEPVVSMSAVKYPSGPSPSDRASAEPLIRKKSESKKSSAAVMWYIFSPFFSTCKRRGERGERGREWGGGGGRGERRYATLPQTPPLSDWKVMGLKETFSQHSPHLCDLRARHALTRARRPIKHLINYTACIYIGDSFTSCKTGPCFFLLLFLFF